jgi:hypothetical protein
MRSGFTNFLIYQFKSQQIIKRSVAEHIDKELIFASFVSSFESIKIYFSVKKAVESFFNSN